jgi:hypothetical protein
MVYEPGLRRSMVEHVSEGVFVGYYRCVCGHVWTVAKDGSQQGDVTVRAEPPEFTEQVRRRA